MAPQASDSADRRASVLLRHFEPATLPPPAAVRPALCLRYAPPEASEPAAKFDPRELRSALDGHNVDDRDWVFNLMVQSGLFGRRRVGSRVFVAPDFNQTMEQQRDATMRRIEYLLEKGVFDGWLTRAGPEAELRKLALHDCIGIYDHSLGIKLGVHFFLWGGAIQFLGTKRHHDKWLHATEKYLIKGCFAMSELGHGSNVRGIETVTTYDRAAKEFVINTPCESAQKYWIGGAANHATHTVVFSQLLINGINEGVHAFIVQIRDNDGNVCPNIRIADCGHKIGLNGVDNGRIWFDNVRVPRENLLNSVADVSPDGQYLSAIKDRDQRFAAFLAPLTSGRVTIAVCAIYVSKISLAIAVRYALTRRAFSLAPNEPEVLLLDYPSHQRRLLPLLAKSCAMSCAGLYLKKLYVNRSSESIRTLHVISSAFKVAFSWHKTRTLQECREACGGQGLKTENRIGNLMGEFDVQSTFEGDNNVLMQQVSKILLAEFTAGQRGRSPLGGLGLDYLKNSHPVLPSELTSSTLRSSHFQLDVYRIREHDLLKRFASQISQYQSHGESKEQAFMKSYQLAEDLAWAFTDRMILQLFLEAEIVLPTGPLKSVFGLLRSMYAMVILDEDASFLRYGQLTANNAAAIRTEIMKLCGELRPHALALVSSLGIPDSFLSPLAFDWIEANSWSAI